MTLSTLQFVADAPSGHVNNVQYMDFLERARKDWYYFCRLTGVEAMVVHVSASYKKETFDKEQLTITTTLTKIGNTSFTLHQVITNCKDDIVVDAEIVLAVVNIETRKKTSVPTQVRSLLEEETTLSSVMEEYSLKNFR